MARAPVDSVINRETRDRCGFADAGKKLGKELANLFCLGP